MIVAVWSGNYWKQNGIFNKMEKEREGSLLLLLLLLLLVFWFVCNNLFSFILFYTHTHTNQPHPLDNQPWKQNNCLHLSLVISQSKTIELICFFCRSVCQAQSKPEPTPQHALCRCLLISILFSALNYHEYAIAMAFSIIHVKTQM